jgi:hypothetical protein
MPLAGTSLLSILSECLHGLSSKQRTIHADEANHRAVLFVSVKVKATARRRSLVAALVFNLAIKSGFSEPLAWETKLFHVIL